MLCFTRYIPLIIGHFIEEDDEHWKLVKYLRRMLDILTCHYVTHAHAKYLVDIVKRHNELYIKLYGTLKPKFHFLTHYPRLLLELGPCIHYSTDRLESRQRLVKAVVQSTSSKKNLLHTIGVKQVLNFCQTICNAQFPDLSLFAANDEVTVDNFCKNVTFFKKVVIHGRSYELGMFFICSISSTNKLFGKIIKIIRVKNNTYFTMEIHEEIFFHDHFHSYVVERNSKEDIFY